MDDDLYYLWFFVQPNRDHAPPFIGFPTKLFLDRMRKCTSSALFDSQKPCPASVIRPESSPSHLLPLSWCKQHQDKSNRCDRLLVSPCFFTKKAINSFWSFQGDPVPVVISSVQNRSNLARGISRIIFLTARNGLLEVSRFTRNPIGRISSQQERTGREVALIQFYLHIQETRRRR